jgi:predicted DNA-binding antitoxin AbrB/MazE fold protein
MTRVVEAIYEDGMLRPVEALDLPDHQRVRLVVETVDEKKPDREAAYKRLLAGIEQMNFRSTGPYPTRDELHERR